MKPADSYLHTAYNFILTTDNTTDTLIEGNLMVGQVMERRQLKCIDGDFTVVPIKKIANQIGRCYKKFKII